MSAMKNISISLMAALLLFVGCVKDETSLGKQYTGQEVECVLNLSVAPMEGGTAATKALPDDLNETTIKDLWVIQFSSKGLVIGEPTYIEDYTESSTIKLVSQSGGEIMYIANSNNPYLPIYEDDSIDKVASLTKIITSMEDCYTNSNLILSGLQDVSIADDDNGIQIESTLKHNVAKVSFTFDNMEASGLTINSVQMCNVSNQMNYYYDAEDVSEMEYMPEYSQFDVIDYEISDDMDDVTFIIPANKRGVADNDEDANKPLFANDQATYLKICATTSEGSGREFNLYLGANLTNDFNILPNYSYTYDITFNSSGNIDDSRVSVLEDVDFTQYKSSNCYMIAPSTTARTYKIPIKDRINTFWGTDYENVPANTITSSSVLESEIVWYQLVDCDANTANTISLTISDDKASIFVTIPANCPEGNLVFGVRNSSATTYLWSWHLWITPYSPNYYTQHTVKSGVYKYYVPNGELHRYTNVNWSHDNYKNTFVMDRNLGAMYAGVNYAGIQQGAVCYQYGRKDPMAVYSTTRSPNPLYYYDISDKIYTLSEAGVSHEVKSDGTMKATVRNPATFYIQPWTSEDTYCSSSNIWSDPKISSTLYKSLFDPSPLGWRLISNTLLEYKANSSYLTSISSTYNTVTWLITQGNAFGYSPNGYSDPESEDSSVLAIFPRAHYLTTTTGKIQNDSRCINWCSQADASSTYSGVSYTFSPNSTSSYLSVTNIGHQRSYAMQVRCQSHPDDFVTE